jgi:hypothetical protein
VGRGLQEEILHNCDGPVMFSADSYLITYMSCFNLPMSLKYCDRVTAVMLGVVRRPVRVNCVLLLTLNANLILISRGAYQTTPI